MSTTERTKAIRIFFEAVKDYNPTTEEEWQFILDLLQKSKSSKLKAARLENLYTVPEAATAIGITTEALTAYEAGKRTPRDSVKLRIAELYQMPVSALFF